MYTIYTHSNYIYIHRYTSHDIMTPMTEQPYSGNASGSPMLAQHILRMTALFVSGVSWPHHHWL